MFQTATFPAAVIPSEPTKNTIIDRRRQFSIWTNSDCPNEPETPAKSVL